MGLFQDFAPLGEVRCRRDVLIPEHGCWERECRLPQGCLPLGSLGKTPRETGRRGSILFMCAAVSRLDSRALLLNK